MLSPIWCCGWWCGHSPQSPSSCLFTACLCLATPIFRVFFVSPLYTLESLQGTWYMTCWSFCMKGFIGFITNLMSNSWRKHKMFWFLSILYDLSENTCHLMICVDMVVSLHNITAERRASASEARLMIASHSQFAIYIYIYLFIYINTQKHLQICTASMCYHLYTKFAESCTDTEGLEAVRSSELWVHRLCRWFQSKIVHAKLFYPTGTCQTLVYAIDGDHWLLHQSSHFSVASVWGQQLKTTVGPDSNQWHAFQEILRTSWPVLE